MKPSLALDPALLAIPAIARNEDEASLAIKALIGIAKSVRNSNDIRFFLISEAMTYLISAGVYPPPSSLADMLESLNLRGVYTTEDIRRAVVDILSRIEQLELLSGVEFLIPSHVVTLPDVLASRAAPLREALEITLLHVAFAGQAFNSKLIQTMIADSLARQMIDITADVDDIDPALEPGSVSRLTAYKAAVWAAPSIDGFIEGLPPAVVWEHAEEAAEIKFAIKLAALEVRRLSGCPAPAANCESFVVGARFLESLERWEGACCGRHATTTLESCARVIARMPKNDVARFFKPAASKGKTEDVVRQIDKAEAWRSHITKDHEGMRLMFWRRVDGSIELANIGPKAELEIF